MTVIVSPREYVKHRRHTLTGARRRHDDQATAFLSQQTIRLLTTDNTANRATMFGKITKYGAARVKAATNISQLP